MDHQQIFEYNLTIQLIFIQIFLQAISFPNSSRTFPLKMYKNSFLPGPACSDTIEPVAGVSKHFKTVVITYSAEGSITGEEAEDQYPYFFRTIAENGQYK